MVVNDESGKLKAKMEFERASLNYSQSDYSDASIVSLGPSIQAEDSTESIGLLNDVPAVERRRGM